MLIKWLPYADILWMRLDARGTNHLLMISVSYYSNWTFAFRGQDEDDS